MDVKPTVSVIVPVFNAESSLEKCVNSIVAQQGVGVEVVLVDDRSADGSLKLCREFASRLAGVTVVAFEENRGPSAARNAGLKVARGDFIAFVDSDDYIDPGMFSQMVTAASDFDVPVVCCGVTREVEGQKKQEPIAAEPCVVDPMRYLEDMLFSPLAGYLCNRLYSRALLKGLFLDESIRFSEDLVFNCAVWDRIASVAYIPQCPYVYVENQASLTMREDAFIVDGNWAFSSVMPALRAALPKDAAVESLLFKREIKYALYGIRYLSGSDKHVGVRKELMNTCRKAWPDYRSVEPSLAMRVLDWVTLHVPEALLTLGLKALHYSR